MFRKERSNVLSEEQQTRLLQLARATIEARLAGAPLPEVHDEEMSEIEFSGAFVTLTRHGQLRGCIGLIGAQKSLEETVQIAAEGAALKDPRFPPLTPEELKDTVIEISVLSPLQRIRSVRDIKVGRHGLLIKLGAAQGLLLPQVATENQWDRQTFLEHVCLKAGLPKDAWRSPEAELLVFEAQVFHESKVAESNA